MQTKKEAVNTLNLDFLQLVASSQTPLDVVFLFQRVLKNNNAWAASARPAFPQQISFLAAISLHCHYILTTITTEKYKPC